MDELELLIALWNQRKEQYVRGHISFESFFAYDMVIGKYMTALGADPYYG